MPSLSVVVPFHNSERYITDVLECFSRQDITEPWEIVFVNNRSKDSTVELIRNYKGKLPEYRILNAEDQAGAGYARNVGVPECKAPNVGFCDSDDKIPNSWARKMLDDIREFGFVACDLGEMASNEEKFKGHNAGDASKLYYMGYLPFSGSGTLGIRKAFFLEAGGFDTNLRFCEDVDFCYRVQLLGHRLYASRDNEMYYRSRSTEWNMFKQRFAWGRYEKAVAIRFKRFGHGQERAKGSWFKIVKFSLIFLLRFYDANKRIRYGLEICRNLAAALPPIEAAKQPIMIDENKIVDLEILFDDSKAVIAELELEPVGEK